MLFGSESCILVVKVQSSSNAKSDGCKIYEISRNLGECCGINYLAFDSIADYRAQMPRSSGCKPSEGSMEIASPKAGAARLQAHCGRWHTDV